METKEKPRLQLRSVKTDLCPVPGWGLVTASSSKQSWQLGLSNCPLSDYTHSQSSTEEKAPVILLFYHIPESTAPPQELGSLKRSNYIPPPKGTKKCCAGTVLRFPYGYSADITGNWSGQAQLREGEGQLENQLCCIALSAIPVPVQRLHHIWTQAQDGSPADLHWGSLKIAFWD